MRLSVRETGIIFISLLLLIPLASLQQRIERNAPQTDLVSTPLYLPEIETVRLITLGFDAFFSDILWFSTVNYFGREFHSTGSYQWFGHRCRLTISLHPFDLERAEFCATLLSWIAKDPKSSNEVLSLAIKDNPQNWRLFYLRSFNYWYFLGETEKGADDLRIASQLKDAPPSLASLAARLLTAATDPQIVILYLEEALRRTTNSSAREALIARLNEVRQGRNFGKPITTPMKEQLK